MFDGASNVQLGGKLLKFYYPKLIVIIALEHKVSLLFNYFSKTPFLHQIIASHKTIYNIFGYIIFHKPHSIFKYKSHDFNNRNIVIVVVTIL